ncbi:hypothetical protein Smp_170420 [Schistosoma mansoni]|uniref:CIA30 domain-containing protein n=1 Tax=Schistosoma mansoni TaxID=6183 RepID=G4VDQ2_SCHMA|nr:hypothetical protein Smp_170420 [Schistosoma mansoni]|eukprot:XP_018649613.1 hypothetical protein Smp_170420 [Schistosoma mansoni]
MNTNILLATTFTILSLHTSIAAHMNTNLTTSLTISLGLTAFDAIRQQVVKFINQPDRPTGPVLFNFTEIQNKLCKWIELSDTVGVEGRSDAVLVRHVAYISRGRQQIKLPFHTFKANFRAAQYSISLPSFLNQVSRISIQAYDGHNAPQKEFGSGSIEIYFITALKLKPTGYY